MSSQRNNSLLSTLYAISKNPVQQPYKPGMKRNAAGGYVFEMSPYDQFMQFLRLGTHNSFYVSQLEMTADRLAFVCGYMDAEPDKAMTAIGYADFHGSLMPNAILFALAYLNTTQNPATNHAAANMVTAVVRTGYHAEMYLSYLNAVIEFRRARGEKIGWGRSKTRGLKEWAESLTDRELVLQGIKYAQREGTRIQDVINVSHPQGNGTPKRNIIMKWLMNCDFTHEDFEDADKLILSNDPDIEQIIAFNRIREQDCSPALAATLVRKHNLPREAVPTKMLRHAEVWKALMPMPTHATLRNLATLERFGLLEDPEVWSAVESSLSNDRLLRDKVLPAHILKAYAAVKSVKLMDMLNGMFFGLLSTQKPLSYFKALIAVDLSGSMTAPAFNIGMRCYEVANAMALAYASSFGDAKIIGFDDSIHHPVQNYKSDLGIPIFNEGGGGTHASLITAWLRQQEEWRPDVVLFLTDSQNWMGGHVQREIDTLRSAWKRPVVLVVNAFEANGSSLADASDPLSLNVTGFDVSAIEAVHTKLHMLHD